MEIMSAIKEVNDCVLKTYSTFSSSGCWMDISQNFKFTFSLLSFYSNIFCEWIPWSLEWYYWNRIWFLHKMHVKMLRNDRNCNSKLFMRLWYYMKILYVIPILGWELQFFQFTKTRSVRLILENISLELSRVAWIRVGTCPGPPIIAVYEMNQTLGTLYSKMSRS